MGNDYYNDYLGSLTELQKKFVRYTKDVLDQDNRTNQQNNYLLIREISHPNIETKPIFQVVANTISKQANDWILGVINFATKNEEQKTIVEEDPHIIQIDNLKSNDFSINEKLKYTHKLREINSPISEKDGLIFYIKLSKPSTVKSFGLKYTDGNIASYKIDILFTDTNNQNVSECLGLRNSRLTALMEFYELEQEVKNIDRITLKIVSKSGGEDKLANIDDFILINDIVSPELKEAKLISVIPAINQASKFNYMNHPSLMKIRVATNEKDYPTLYEFEELNIFDKLENNNYLRLYNPVLSNNRISGESITLRFQNPNINKYDDNVSYSKETLLKKGYIKLGSFKNKFIGFKMIPIDFNDDWSINFVTRGGNIESTDNLFQSIVEIGNEFKFSFNRQLIRDKADSFTEGLEPAFELKLHKDQEIAFAFYQFNINETDVQYYIYTKQHNDLEWRIFNSFIDDKSLVGEMYGEQTVSWGGLYDYIFFTGFKQIKFDDIRIGELVTPIRKVE